MCVCACEELHVCVHLYMYVCLLALSMSSDIMTRLKVLSPFVAAAVAHCSRHEKRLLQICSQTKFVPSRNEYTVKRLCKYMYC